MMLFSDIPKMTNWGNYGTDVGWEDLVYCLNRYEKRYDLKMNPDFQRGHVWTPEQSRNFVEFRLRGGHSGGDILFNYPSWQSPQQKPNGDMLLVDGLQRLSSVIDFLNNKLSVFHNLFFSDFSGNMDMFNCSFRFHINGLATRKEVLQWYLDINTGGSIHTPEEIQRVQNLLKMEP